jgi:hypothetical protein
MVCRNSTGSYCTGLDLRDVVKEEETMVKTGIAPCGRDRESSCRPREVTHAFRYADAVLIMSYDNYVPTLRRDAAASLKGMRRN